MDKIPMKIPEGFILEPVQHTDMARDTLAVIFKWKWLICGVLLAVALPVAIFSVPTTPQYRATARTIVKQDRAYLSITPGDESRAMNVPVSRATINSELRVLKSREVSERAIEELRSELVETELLAQIPDDVSSIQQRLDVTPVPDSNVIEISYVDDNPGLAVKIVNKIAETYQVRHAEINRPPGAHEFFERQASIYLERLREAERNLKVFEQREGVVDLAKELVDARALVDRLERDLQGTVVQLAEERTRLNFLKEEINKHPARIATAEETVPNRVVEQLRARLFQLELEKGTLLQLYTEKDRRVIGKQEEIDAVRRDLANQESYVAGRKESALNPIRRNMEQDLVTGQAKLISLTSKQRILSNQLELARDRLTRLDQASSTYNELKKTLELSQHNYVLFHRRSEAAQISDAMDREKWLNVAILERAALPLAPLKGPRQAMTLMLAAFAGIALGFGVAFGIEFFNTSVQTEKMLEDQLNLPVLATIEKFPV
jgi:polysaccharide biosynthesis transport protein